jgi:hypothetical protein
MSVLRYGQVTLGMELKVWRDGESNPLKEGLEQLDHYLDGLVLAAGWLVIFDQRSGLPDISELKIGHRAVQRADKKQRLPYRDAPVFGFC